MKKEDIITSLVCAVLGILTLIIRLNVISLNDIGYARHPIDVMLVLIIFAVFWAVPTGLLIGNALVPSPPHEKEWHHPIGPSYKTKNVEGLIVRDYET